jgi:hypothetical protein
MLSDISRRWNYLDDARRALREALAGHEACCLDCGRYKEFTPCAASLRLRAALRCLDWSVPLRSEDSALVREG